MPGSCKPREFAIGREGEDLGPWRDNVMAALHLACGPTFARGREGNAEPHGITRSMGTSHAKDGLHVTNAPRDDGAVALLDGEQHGINARACAPHAPARKDDDLA